jgi:hypothetical protein
MDELVPAIFIIHNITICNNWNLEMLAELIYTSEICFTGKCLLVGATMDTYEIGACILESLTELREE